MALCHELGRQKYILNGYEALYPELRMVVSNIYCVVFLFCVSSSCVPYVANCSGISIFDCRFGIL